MLQVGVGSVGRRRLAILGARPSVNVVGAVDLDPSAASHVGDVPWLGADLHDALAKTQPDVVIVSTPHGAHLQQVTAALQAGAHVLCEKPLGLGAEEVRALADLAGRLGKRLAMARNHLHLPSVAAALALIAEDKIGAVTHIDAQVGHGRGADLSPWHRSQANAGGGCLRDNGAHGLLICEAVWAAQSDTAVTARAIRSAALPGSDVDGEFVGQVTSGGGRTLALHTSWQFTDGYRFRVHIQGQGGEIRIAGPVGVRWRADGGDWQEVSVVDAGPMASWQKDTDDFLRWVTRGDGPAGASLAAGVWSASVTDALYRSAQSGEPVAL